MAGKAQWIQTLVVVALLAGGARAGLEGSAPAPRTPRKKAKPASKKRKATTKKTKSVRKS